MKKLILTPLVLYMVFMLIGCSNVDTISPVKTPSNSLAYIPNQQNWYPVDYLENYPERIEIEDENLVEIIGIRANAICTSSSYNFNSPNDLTPIAISTYIYTVFKDYAFSKDIIEQGTIA